MPTYAKKPEINYTPVPEGTHIARCYSLIHIGTVKTVWQGNERDTYKVRLAFEFPYEKKVFTEGEGEKPLVMSSEYTLSMSSKSSLRKVVEGIVGKKFTDDDAYDFDLESVVGTPCQIQVVHEKKDDKLFANIGAVMPLAKGQTCPPQFNETNILSFDNWSDAVFESLPKFIKDKIMTSKEYQEKNNANVPSSDIPF